MYIHVYYTVDIRGQGTRGLSWHMQVRFFFSRDGVLSETKVCNLIGT